MAHRALIPAVLVMLYASPVQAQPQTLVVNEIAPGVFVPTGQIAQMIVNQLDVIDTGIDRGGKVLLVARGFVE